MASDQDLVLRIRRGDEEAFEALYEKYRGPIYRSALAITRDRGIAEEVLQDCFLRAHQHADRIDPELGLGAWLHRIALNLAYDRLSRRRLLLAPLDALVDRLTADARQLPDEVAEQHEATRIVLQAVSTLSLNHRAAVVLFYLQDFSLAEIAYILDCPVGTVKSRLHYGIKELRRRLSPYFATPLEAAYETVT